MKEEQLIRFIERKCTAEEVREISVWINTSQENKRFFHEFQTIWASVEIANAITRDKPDPASIRKILSEIRRTKRLRLYKRFGYVAAAAAAVLLLLLLIPFNKTSPGQVDYEAVLSETVLTGDIQLMLGDGEILSVADSSAEIRYDRKGNLIVQEDTIEAGEKEIPVLHTIQVPYGKRGKVILADGSTVHLNSGTSFIYPSLFDGKYREVFLHGEAFFDVKKDERKTFFVKTPFKTVEVLGTRFNVSVDKEDKQFEAVLLSGKIVLDGEKGVIEMQPNQLYRYSEEQKRETLREVEAGNYISWIDGRIVFEQEPLHAVIRKLEKMYNVRISLLDRSLLTHSISGDLNIKDSPEETMNILMNILIAGYDPQEGKLYQFD